MVRIVGPHGGRGEPIRRVGGGLARVLKTYAANFPYFAADSDMRGVAQPKNEHVPPTHK